MDLFTFICILLIFLGLIINACAEDKYMMDWREYEEYREDNYYDI